MGKQSAVRRRPRGNKSRGAQNAQAKAAVKPPVRQVAETAESAAPKPTAQDQGKGQGQGPTPTQIMDKEKAPLSLPASSIETHRHWGVFLARNRFDAIQLLTRNWTANSNSSTQFHTNSDDYGEQRIISDFRGKRCEFRSWSPFQSKLAAGIMGGVRNLHLRGGCKVLYLGAGFGRTVSHIADIIGESGLVYAVEQGPWAERQLAGLAVRRPNVVPVIEDATMPYKYRQQVPAGVDLIFCDLPQVDQVRSLMLNARHFLAFGGHFVTFVRVKGSGQEMIAAESERLRQNHLEPLEHYFLEPYKPGYALVVGVCTRKDVTS